MPDLYMKFIKKLNKTNKTLYNPIIKTQKNRSAIFFSKNATLKGHP